MYKNFIFDMGNVLLDFSPDYILSQFTHDPKEIESLKYGIFAGEGWKQLDNGDTTLEEIITDALKKVSPEQQAVAERVMREWQNYMPERAEMVKIVHQLKDAGHGVYLCSNAAANFRDYFNNYDVFNHFDDLVISGEIHMSKPDRGIYEHVLTKNKLDPETCLFIDDSQANIVGAKKCGIAGYHFNGNAALFDRYLRAIGVY
ncbi:HAD family phosphatase [Erysipelothrix sp. HDW6C]|uniref:HAD family hydrolase n=1 Tax=Erysipelothrix sp. HDW6C TaxID=2714930 RepID=UPI00140D486C|nr:HAD family phosphatase [Erysipelothrix sp. HDW6C]QIK69044.1 HAD family phosphatase [Erysipelothrix sp. HDW6C]